MQQLDSPKVSVFMPTYNHVHFIEEAIEGVLAQDYPNIELVIGDDGSTDGTQDLLRKYKERYPDLICLLLSEKNEGATKNFNKILRHCTGEFVALTSGDDVWLPEKLWKQLKQMAACKDAVLCYTKEEVFSSETGTILAVTPPSEFEQDRQDSVIEHAGAVLTFAGTTALMRRDAIPPGGFRKELASSSDWFFFIEVLRRGRSVYVPEVLARYRRHGKNYSLSFQHLYSQNLIMLGLLEDEYPDLREQTERFRKEFVRDRILRFYLQQGDGDFNRGVFVESLRVTGIKEILGGAFQELGRRLVWRFVRAGMRGR